MHIPYLFKKAKGGFTLVELMVVIAIIALLTAIIITNLTSSKAKSRDAKRASDLAQIQLAIEQYFDRCNQYPVSPLATTNADGCPPGGVTLGNFISKLPTDPTNTGSYVYTYATNGTPPSDYVLYVTFEQTNTAVAQSAPNPAWLSTGTFNCASGLNYCVRPN